MLNGVLPARAGLFAPFYGLESMTMLKVENKASGIVKNETTGGEITHNDHKAGSDILITRVVRVMEMVSFEYKQIE